MRLNICVALISSFEILKKNSKIIFILIFLSFEIITQLNVIK